jgi:hypothetical protein
MIRNFVITSNDPHKVVDYLKSLNETIYSKWDKFIEWDDPEDMSFGFLDDEEQCWDWDKHIYWEETYPNRTFIDLNILLREEKIKRILK